MTVGCTVSLKVQAQASHAQTLIDATSTFPLVAGHPRTQQTAEGWATWGASLPAVPREAGQAVGWAVALSLGLDTGGFSRGKTDAK